MAVDYKQLGNQIAIALSEVPNVTISYETQVASSASSYNPTTGLTTGGSQTGSFLSVYLGETRYAKEGAEVNAKALTEYIAVLQNLPTGYVFNSSTVFTINGVEWSYASHDIEPSGNAIFLKMERVNG